MPRRWYAAAMARTRGKGDVNRRRRRDPERNLEGERRDLKRDRMARQLGLADPSHQESGAGEQPRFRQDGQADRGSDPQHLEETAPFGAPPIAEQAKERSDERRGGTECVSTGRSRWDGCQGKNK